MSHQLQSAPDLGPLRRLITIARGQSEQARHVAAFLLSWWSAETCGGFDLRSLRAVDRAVAEDMTAVFALVARSADDPEQLDPAFGAGFRAILREWWPELAT